MKVGDIVMSNHGPLYGHPMIVCIRQLEPLQVNSMHVRICDPTYAKNDSYDKFNIMPKHVIENPTLQQAAECLQYASLVVPKFKDQLSEWLKQKVIEEFGEPPKKIVEAAYPNITSATDSIEELEPVTLVAGFIKINRG